MSHIWLCQHAVKLLFVARCMHALSMLFEDDWSYACSEGSLDLWLIEVFVHPCMTVPVLHALHAAYSAYAFALRDAVLFNSGPAFMC